MKFVGQKGKNGFGKCSLFVLSANGWKDQKITSSFSRQRKPAAAGCNQSLI